MRKLSAFLCFLWHDKHIMFGKSSQRTPQHFKDLGADGPLDSRILKAATQGKSVSI